MALRVPPVVKVSPISVIVIVELVELVNGASRVGRISNSNFAKPVLIKHVLVHTTSGTLDIPSRFMKQSLIVSFSPRYLK